jgi:hypothetical protein
MLFNGGFEEIIESGFKLIEETSLFKYNLLVLDS